VPTAHLAERNRQLHGAPIPGTELKIQQAASNRQDKIQDSNRWHSQQESGAAQWTAARANLVLLCWQERPNISTSPMSPVPLTH
jgi:hypothetical protein